MGLSLAFGAATASAASFGLGDQGTDVAEIQGALADLGYDVVADGDYGVGTVAAVKDFQSSHHLRADGNVGQDTYTALLGRAMPQVSRGTNYYHRRIISKAMEYLGTPYVFGGSSPYGFDCSGYVRYVFAHAGVYLPRMADEQYEVGMPVMKSDLRPGDLVYFTTYTYGVSHVGIYLGDHKFIHASSSRGVCIDTLQRDYWVGAWVGARRVL